MCGRIVVTFENAPLIFGSEEIDFPEYENYNVTPGQFVPILRKEAGFLKWGLVPFWSSEPKTKYNLINARAETIESKPSFREAFKKRRCIIIANGFYEWKQAPGGKQPYFIYPKNRKYFYFAGIWEKWQKGDQILETFAIITTHANRTMKTIHHRMPVILSEKEALAWIQHADKTLLKPCQDDLIKMHAVDRSVNSPQNNHPGLIKKVEAW